MKITINRRQWDSMSKSSQNIPLIKKKINANNWYNLYLNSQQLNKIKMAQNNIQERKNKILNDYKYFGEIPRYPKIIQINTYKTLLNMMEEFKDDDFVISVLYRNLYKKIQEYNKELEKELEQIKSEQDRPVKISKLINFYKRAYTNVGKDEIRQVQYDIGIMTIEEINNYIDKYVNSWKEI
jgi:hypothetical protein